MLIAAAVRGAKVDWQILLDPTRAVEDQQVLQYQRLAVEEYIFCAGLDSTTYAQSGRYHVGFHTVTLEQLKQVRRERGTGVLLRKGTNWTLAAVDYSDEYGTLAQSGCGMIPRGCKRCKSDMRDGRRTRSQFSIM